MAKKKKRELAVVLCDYVLDYENGYCWRWWVDAFSGMSIHGTSYSRKDSAKRGAIRALTRLGMAEKYNLVFMVAE